MIDETPRQRWAGSPAFVSISVNSFFSYKSADIMNRRAVPLTKGVKWY